MSGKEEFRRGISKVAVDVHVIEGRPQGSRTTLTNLLGEIGGLGRAADIALYGDDPTLCRHRIGDFPFGFVKVGGGGSFRRLLLALPRALARNRAKVAMWQYISSPLYFGRSVVVIHDVLPYTHPNLFPLLFRLRCQVLFLISMILANKIVVVSDFSRRELQRIFPFLANKVELVPNGPSFLADFYWTPAAGSKRERRYILAVGRIEERKNIDMLARAFVQTGLDDVDLIIVGKRDLGYAGSIPKHPNIHVLESVDNDALINLYKGAELFVFPSKAEGFGLPLLDAILFGVPCISSDRTAMPEVAGGLAKFFDPTAPDGQAVLASAILQHFSGQPIPAPTLEQRKLHFERFSWRSGALKVLRIFDELLAGET